MDGQCVRLVFLVLFWGGGVAPTRLGKPINSKEETCAECVCAEASSIQRLVEFYGIVFTAVSHMKFSSAVWSSVVTQVAISALLCRVVPDFQHEQWCKEARSRQCSHFWWQEAKVAHTKGWHGMWSVWSSGQQGAFASLEQAPLKVRSGSHHAPYVMGPICLVCFPGILKEGGGDSVYCLGNLCANLCVTLCLVVGSENESSMLSLWVCV